MKRLLTLFFTILTVVVFSQQAFRTIKVNSNTQTITTSLAYGDKIDDIGGDTLWRITGYEAGGQRLVDIVNKEPLLWGVFDHGNFTWRQDSAFVDDFMYTHRYIVSADTTRIWDEEEGDSVISNIIAADTTIKLLAEEVHTPILTLNDSALDYINMVGGIVIHTYGRELGGGTGNIRMNKDRMEVSWEVDDGPMGMFMEENSRVHFMTDPKGEILVLDYDTVSAPIQTISVIDAANNKALTTKEWVTANKTDLANFSFSHDSAFVDNTMYFEQFFDFDTTWNYDDDPPTYVSRTAGDTIVRFIGNEFIGNLYKDDSIGYQFLRFRPDSNFTELYSRFGIAGSSRVVLENDDASLLYEADGEPSGIIAADQQVRITSNSEVGGIYEQFLIVNDTVSLPRQTISIIDAAGGKTAITKEWSAANQYDGTNDGTTEGQLLYWNTTTSKWTYADVADFRWKADSSILTAKNIDSDTIFVGIETVQFITDKAELNVYGRMIVSDTFGHIFIGRLAGLNAIEPDQPLYNNPSIGIGTNALNDLTDGVANTAIGTSALSRIEDGNFNTAVGYGTMSSGSNKSIYNNTAVGFSSLSSNTGNNNTGLGYWSGYGIVSGNGNTFLGSNTARWGCAGTGNSFVGYQAGFNISSGSYNVAFGQSALNDMETGQRNIAIGHNSLGNAEAGTNIAVGANALSALNQEGDHFSYNIGIGYYAGSYSVDTNDAGVRLADSLHHCMLIGDDTETLHKTDTNSMVFGYAAEGKGSNSVVIGNDDIDSTFLKGYVDIDGQYILPLSDGTVGQAVVTDGAGNLSFGDGITSLWTTGVGTNSMYQTGVDPGDITDNNYMVAVGRLGIVNFLNAISTAIPSHIVGYCESDSITKPIYIKGNVKFDGDSIKTIDSPTFVDISSTGVYKQSAEEVTGAKTISKTNVYCTSAATGIFDLTLPAYSSSTGNVHWIQNYSGWTVTLKPASGEVLDAVTDGTITMVDGTTVRIHNSGIASVGWSTTGAKAR